MNTSFDPLKLVNTYGAFGSITRKRTEYIISATNVTDPRPRLSEFMNHWDPMVSKLVFENLVKGESKTVIGWNMNSTVNQVVLIVSLVSSVHIIIGSIG